MLTLVFKDNKFGFIQEFVNIHSGPVIDVAFSRYFVSTGSPKDFFVQMIGAEELGDTSFIMSLTNRLEFLIPKLKSDYDSWNVKSIPLPQTTFTTFEITSDSSTAILASQNVPGLVKLSIANPSVFTTVMPDKKVSSILSCTKNFLLATEGDRSLCLTLPDLSEINKIKAPPLRVDKKNNWANLKHFNSEDVILWMKESGVVQQVNSDNLSVQTLPPLEIQDAHVLIACASSNSMGIAAMYLKHTVDEKEDRLIVVKHFETVISSKLTSVVPNSSLRFISAIRELYRADC